MEMTSVFSKVDGLPRREKGINFFPNRYTWCVAKIVTHNAAVAFAKPMASTRLFPSAKATANPALKASPAPLCVLSQLSNQEQ
jgi:hypothetical protein